LTHKDQDKDKDLNLVLKESLRTRARTRINITAKHWTQRQKLKRRTEGHLIWTLLRVERVTWWSHVTQCLATTHER